MAHSTSHHNYWLPRPIKNWLIICAAMVLTMAVIGAITRLTESGLSMTTWHATKDMLPPLNVPAWQAEFAKYQQSPEYQQLNRGMSLAEFKNIYFWEWLHRLWGRLIGLAFALPLLYFWIRGQVPQAYKKPFLGLLLLGACQGFMGWYMVKSGLIDRPSVSHFRLAAHLSLAMVIFCGLCWQVFKSCLKEDLSSQRKLGSIDPQDKTLSCLTQNGDNLFMDSSFRWNDKLKMAWICTLTTLALTMVWGAYVAGLDAGLVYNEFPKMGGHWFPSDGLFLQPIWHNFFYTHATVQWVHRVLACLSWLTVCGLAWQLYQKTTAPFLHRRLPLILVALITIQFMLGVATLLSGVNISLAAMHQGNAFLILAAMMRVGVGLRQNA
jgi:heme a synthase